MIQKYCLEIIYNINLAARVTTIIEINPLTEHAELPYNSARLPTPASSSIFCSSAPSFPSNLSPNLDKTPFNPPVELQK